MRTQSVSVSTSGSAANSSPIFLDPSLSSFDVGAAMVEVVDGATFKLQHSYDNHQTPAASVTWHDYPSASGKTATYDVGGLTIPCTMLRVVITTGSVGTVRLDVCQYG